VIMMLNANSCSSWCRDKDLEFRRTINAVDVNGDGALPGPQIDS
jgi:hypothetical protein